MKLLLLRSLLLLIIIGQISCKSDTPKPDDNSELKEVSKEISESEKHLQNIARAHNASKFKEEAQVKFKLKIDIRDEAFFDGFVTLKTDGSQARYLDSNIDKTLEIANLETDLDKKLYMMAELYTMGFWFDSENFNLISKSDSLDLSDYHSEKLDADYKIYSHPLTHVIQQIDFKTTIADKPFDNGSLMFDDYITVNRVPVALKWKIILNEEQIATAEISRISYPKTF